MARDGFPVYFAGQDIVGVNLTIRKGQAFPPDMQDPNILRGLAKAAGTKNADALPFHKLPFVKIVDAGTQDHAQLLLQQALTYDAALKATTRETRHVD